MTIWLWVGFLTFVGLMLWLDLAVLNRRAHVVRAKEALIFSSVCAILALLFCGVVYYLYEYHVWGIGLTDRYELRGREAALQFFMGWVVEQSLSLDNIFVIAMIFAYFNVPMKYQHRTLFWGILGALLARGLMIGAGVLLIERFSWVLYIFGVLLVITAIKMLAGSGGHVDPDRNPLLRLARRVYPVSSEFDGQKFFTRVNGVRAMTPLFLVLLVIESTDVLFAIDSIPAIFAITHPHNDPFIVFTSNVFAILNLRSLYFALADLMDRFRYLKYSLVVILAYVGVKMLFAAAHHDRLAFGFSVPSAVSLIVIGGSLVAGVVLSLVLRPKPAKEIASGE